MPSRNEYSMLFPAFLLASFLLVACGQRGGGCAAPGIFSAVASQSSISPGVTCEFGGIRIDSGIDENHNGKLDPTEIDSSDSICNSAGGPDPLVSITNVPAGYDCSLGGILIESGLDDDNNGILNSAEIITEKNICNEMHDMPC
jgi:hypothetical protein